MKIVLEKADIEEIIKNQYQGVEEIVFNTKNIKATLEVDTAKFSAIKAIKTFPIKETQMKPVESKPRKLTNDERASKGAMASGGVERAMRHIG